MNHVTVVYTKCWSTPRIRRVYYFSDAAVASDFVRHCNDYGLWAWDEEERCYRFWKKSHIIGYDLDHDVRALVGSMPYLDDFCQEETSE